MIFPASSDKVMIGRREDEMLLQCVRSYIDPSEARRTESLARQDIDWEHVIQAALDHRVLPFVYHSLHRFCPTAVPNLIMDRLRELYQANARRNLFLSSELLKLVRLFDSGGISAIAFKGPVLSASAYGNLSFRQCLDLDVLVRKKDILKAKELILSSGYRPLREMTEEQEQSHLESYHAFVFLAKSGPYSVDLHWAVTRPHYSSAFDPEALWKRVESVPFAGGKILTFNAEQMILILSVHGSKHCWQQLGWICDVALLVRSRPDLDWRRVVREARTAGCFRELLLALTLAKNLLGASLPDSVLRLLKKHPGFKSATRMVTRQLFCAEQSLLLRRFQRLIFLFRLKRSTKDRLAFLLYEMKVAMTPSAKDAALLPLPVALSFLHYITRPVRLTVSYGLLPLIRSAKHHTGKYWASCKRRRPTQRPAVTGG